MSKSKREVNQYVKGFWGMTFYDVFVNICEVHHVKPSVIVGYHSSKKNIDNTVVTADLGKSWFHDVKDACFYGTRNYPVLKKEEALALGLLLELSMQDMTDLLYSAGYVLSSGIPTDVVVSQCIQYGIHNFLEIDAMLDDKGLPMLFSVK